MSQNQPDKRFYLNDLIPVHLLRTERPFEFSKVLAPDNRYVYVIKGYGLDDVLQVIYQRVGLDIKQEDDSNIDQNLVCAALETDLIHFRKLKKETGGILQSEVVEIAEKLSNSGEWWQIPYELIERFKNSKKEEKARIVEKHWSEVFTWEEWEKVLSIISCKKRENPVEDALRAVQTASFITAWKEKNQHRYVKLFESKDEPITEVNE